MSLVCDSQTGMKNLIALLALGAIYYYSQAKEFTENFSVKFLNARLDFVRTRDSGFSRVYFSIKCRIHNNSEFKGAIQSGFMNVSYDGKLVGTARSNSSIEVLPKQDVVVDIPVTLETVKLVNSIPAMFNILSTTRKLTFHLDGKLFFNIGDYTINQNYTVTV